MYTLDDIAAYGLIREGIYYRDGVQYISPYTKSLLKYKIRDYGMLSQAIQKGYPEFQNEFFIAKIAKMEEYLFQLNLKDVSNAMYRFDAYSNSKFDDDVLNNAEEKVNGSKILVSSPLSLQLSTADRLADLNVAEIKALLERIDSRGHNALSYLTSFGPSKILIVVRGIKFLEEQMLRIAASTPDYQEQPDLFMIDAELKREMIRDDLSRIIEEFLSGNDDYVFGKLTDKAKNRIFQSCVNPKRSVDFKIQGRILEMIANYTLSEELYRGESRVRAMGRFH